MAIVKTDNKHYKAIANKIRYHIGEETEYAPEEMPSGIDTAVNKVSNNAYTVGWNDGNTVGLEDGRVQGQSEANAERDAQEAQYLEDINDVVTAYGVGELETLSDVPQAVSSVHSKALAIGEESGYNAGHAAGITEGTQSEYDRLWDAFQDYGNRTDYDYAFRRINAEYIRPKYKVQNLTVSPESFFQFSTVKKIEAAYFDFTGVDSLPAKNESYGHAYAMFNACRQLEEVEDLNLPACIYYGTWNNCVSLRRIAVVRCATGKAFTVAFNNCHALEDVTFTGTLDTNGLSLSASTKLSKASIESVINVLSSTTSGKTVTLSKAAVNKAFETSEGANDGVSSDEWTALIATKSNWTISLV